MSEGNGIPVKPSIALPPASAGEKNGAATEAVSPFRSAEAFDLYCTRIQSRLVEHALQRKHFLQEAYNRLTRLLQAAHAVEDAALYNELWKHRLAARELMDILNSVANGDTALVTTPEGTASSRAVSAPALGSAAGASSIASPSETHSSRSEPPPSPFPAYREPSTHQTFAPAFRPPRRIMRPLNEIEADAVRLRAEIRAWNELFPLRTSAGLNAPNCLRLRAIACRQRRLEEEAGDTEVAEVVELSEDILALLDAADDQDYAVPFDDELDPAPTAYQWGELAERFEEMARAQEAYDWWKRHESQLASSDIQPLAEAIAAIQQRFNRLLFRVGARDPFQQQMFDELRVWAREAQCYLYSLRPKVPIAELVERASTLDAAWQRAQEALAALETRNQSVGNVVALVSEPGFGEDSERDEARLRDALMECKAQNIPASNRTLRDALLPWAAFLEGDDRFREILREINLEWERRQEAGKPEEIDEEADAVFDAQSAELAAVREVTRGKRCLLLGGTCREEHRRKIEEALELSQLVWPSTKPSDPLFKFDTEIRHADIVALLTRFSRKEWKNAQDICAREGKKFVHLTTGYGVSQVIRHFYTQISPEGAARA